MLKAKIVAILLLLGILIVFGLACGGGGAPAPTPTPTPTALPTPTPTPTEARLIEVLSFRSGDGHGYVFLEGIWSDRQFLFAEGSAKNVGYETLPRVICVMKLWRGSTAMNLPTASCGVSVTQILAPSSLEFALQRLETLLATPPRRFLPSAS